MVFAYFLKNDIFYKKQFPSQPPKKPTFLGVFFFEIFLFHFFHILLLAFSNIKMTKTKVHIFLEIDKPPKNIFAPLHTICVFLDQQKTIKLGKTSKKHLGRIFNATLDGSSTQKPPNLGRIFNSTAYIYI